MEKNKLAFTLIEMIVWVFITIILMISVWIFVSSWIKNITIQKQILDKSNDIWNLIQDLNTVFWKNYNIITNTSTSILLRTNYILWTPAYYYIWEKTLTWYCLNDPNIENKYLEFKVFNPVFLTWTVYSWSYIKNEVYSGGQVIAWNWVFWNLHADSQSWTLTYLNNPLWLAYSWNKVYISDSWNNRILYVSW
jgi:competence protein ComGC